MAVAVIGLEVKLLGIVETKDCPEECLVKGEVFKEGKELLNDREIRENSYELSKDLYDLAISSNVKFTNWRINHLFAHGGILYFLLNKNRKRRGRWAR